VAVKPILFTFGLTYGGAVVSLVRPYTGFLIYVAFGIIKPDSLWEWAIPAGNYSRIVAIGFLLGWVLHGCGNWRFGRAALPLAALVGYWLVMVLGAALAPNQSIAWLPVEPMAKVFLPIIAGATLIDSVDKIKQLAWVIVLCQGYLAYEFHYFYYITGVYHPNDFFHGGLDNNGIAITMVTSTGAAFFLGMHSPTIWQRLLALVCALLMAHVVLFSNSRGGMVALIVTGAFSFLLVPKRPIPMLVFALGIAAVLALAGESVQDRFKTIFVSKEEGGDEGGGRLDFWKGCLKSMQQEPLGVGPNHWVVVAPAHGLPARPAHSTWLQTGAELGIPGLACLLGYYLLTAVRLYPYLKERRLVADPWYRYLARMTVSSIVGFLVAAQFVTLEGVELPYYVTLIGIGVLKLDSLDRSARHPIPPATGRVNEP
jgi:O-antigen ligase